jgi:hypothetical protein
MSRWIRTLVAALTLAALLAAPGISAADSSFGSLWSFLTGSWLKAGCLIDPSGLCLATDAGCMIDPDGRCAAKKRPINGKAGCRIDPSGRCLDALPAAPDAGCMIDPNGLCAKKRPIHKKEGCMIDPNGRCKGES